LPIFADEMVGVRRHDLNSVTVVSELGKRVHSTLRVDAEIWRVLSYHDFYLLHDRSRRSRAFSFLCVPHFYSLIRHPERKLLADVVWFP
jgi:hypothetical protein